MVLTGQNNLGRQVLSAHYVEIPEETGLFIYRQVKNSHLGTLRPKSGIVGQAT